MRNPITIPLITKLINNKLRKRTHTSKSCFKTNFEKKSRPVFFQIRIKKYCSIREFPSYHVKAFNYYQKPAVILLTYRRSRLRLCFVTPDTSHVRIETKIIVDNTGAPWCYNRTMYEFVNRSRVTHSRFSIIAETLLHSIPLRIPQPRSKNLATVNSSVYNRRRSYACLKSAETIGRRRCSLNRTQVCVCGLHEKQRPRFGRSKDSWSQKIEGSIGRRNGHPCWKEHTRWESWGYILGRLWKRLLTTLFSSLTRAL